MLHCNISVLPKRPEISHTGIKKSSQNLKENPTRNNLVWCSCSSRLRNSSRVMSVHMKSSESIRSRFHISYFRFVCNEKSRADCLHGANFFTCWIFFSENVIYICLVKYVPCCLYTLNPLSLSLILWSRLLFCFNFIFS